MEATKVLDVLDSSQAWVQAEGVRKHADAPADLLGLRDGVQPVDGHGSTVGTYESVEHADGRGLARAVRPEEAGDFAVSRIEADVLDRDDVAEPLVEIPGVDHRAGPAWSMKNGGRWTSARQSRSSASAEPASMKSAINSGAHPCGATLCPAPGATA